MNYPKGVFDNFPVDGENNEMTMPAASALQLDDKDNVQFMIYSSQIWMRVILNEAHNALYGASKCLSKLCCCLY